MAEPIKHGADGRLEQTAHEDLEQLIETLHQSGTLRALNGLFGQLGEVSEILAEPLNSAPGRNAIGNLLLLLKTLGAIDPTRVANIVDGAQEALAHSHYRRPPGIMKLLTMTLHQDTRRGVYLLLNMLRVIGGESRALRPPSEPAEPALRRLAGSHARG